MKAILVMDMPETCSVCKLAADDDMYHEVVCRGAERTIMDASGEYRIKPDWCPLIPAIGYVEPVGNMVSWEDEE